MQQKNDSYTSLYQQKNNMCVDKQVILNMQVEAMRSQIEKIAQIHHVNLNKLN